MPAGTDGRRSIAGIALIAFLIAAAMAAPTAAAQQTNQPDWAEEAYNDSASMVETYNEKVTPDALGAAGDQLAGETVNLHVEGPNDTVANFSFEMQEDLQIENLQRGTRDDATMRMTVEKETYDRIMDAKNPARAFRTAVRNDEIEIEGIGAVNGVKWGILNGIADLARGFGLF